MTTVANIRFEPYDVYVGRAGHGMDGKFGNPFKNGSRTENIEKYKKYFFKRIKEDTAFRKDIFSLKGKRLGCFCSPRDCHADIIANYLNNYNPLKFAVIGSRSFDDYTLLKSTLDYYDICLIISGGDKGADSLAKKYAIEREISIKEFLPNWDQYGKAAGFIRNKLIINECDEIIAFWDGISKGTKQGIEYAQEIGKPFHVIKFIKSSIETDDIAMLGG